MKHILFPDGNPPAFPGRADLDEGMLWMLAVMDKDDASRRFVVSVFNHYLSRGEISQKQMKALQDILHKTVTRFHDGTLMCQGGGPASQEVQFVAGEVIPFRKASNSEVIE